MVGRLFSFWEGLFPGAMLNFQGVHRSNYSLIENRMEPFGVDTFDHEKPTKTNNLQTLNHLKDCKRLDTKEDKQKIHENS